MKLRDLRRHVVRLGFTPQEQVRWLSPQELLRTALKVGLSSVFADYADRREVQAALPSRRIWIPPDRHGGAWVDYVADLGDGFDSTYTVARLLAAPELAVDPPRDGEGAEPDRGARRAAGAEPGGTGGATGSVLPRGRLLVLGGDAVYPTPSAAGYENRLTGPYRAALARDEVASTDRVGRGAVAGTGPVGPGTGTGSGTGFGVDHAVAGPAPVMVALPGNHDWYDGLTAFLRVFTQRRRIGGWRTEQTRSYFVVRLPQHWWLVGLDTQLGTYIDDPQMRYFREHLSNELEPGDAVVVCTASPTWVRTGEGDPDAFNSLQFFERDVVRRHCHADGSWAETGARVRLWITGDWHHYARYAEEVPDGAPPGAGRQLVTSGLGGAYLLDTHRLPAQLQLPHPGSRMAADTPTRTFRLAGRWPSVRTSRRLATGMFGGPPRGLPFRNPGMWPLAGAVQALAVLGLAWVLGQERGMEPAAVLLRLSAGDAAVFAAQAVVWVGVVLLIGTFLPVLRGRRPRLPGGWVRTALLQLAVAFAGLTAVVAFPWRGGLPDWVMLGLMMLAVTVLAGLVSCYAVGLSIAMSRSPTVRGWQMSAQSIEDFKGFVRLRIDGAGRLTLYPVVVDRVCHDWELTDGDDPATARPVPAGEPPRPYLAEPPIVIDRTGP